MPDPSQNGQQSNGNGDTPSYIKALLAPGRSKSGSRRAWSIDVENVWVPFFTATNIMGDTHLPDDVLGAPLRLAKAKDGSIRFSQTGRPVMRVAAELNGQITIVRENFVAGLQAYTGTVQNERPEAYMTLVEAARLAALPVMEKAQHDIEEAVCLLRQAEGEHPPIPDKPSGKSGDASKQPEKEPVPAGKG